MEIEVGDIEDILWLAFYIDNMNGQTDSISIVLLLLLINHVIGMSLPIHGYLKWKCVPWDLPRPDTNIKQPVK